MPETIQKMPVTGNTKDESMPAVVEATPISTGYLHHAVLVGDQSGFYRTMPNILITYRRALCGVGRAGLRVFIDKDTKEALPWKGIDGCDRCHVRLRKLREAGEL